MGFLSNLFGCNQEDKALREALAQIHPTLDDEAFQLELVHRAMKAMLASAPACDREARMAPARSASPKPTPSPSTGQSANWRICPESKSSPASASSSTASLT